MNLTGTMKNFLRGITTSPRSPWQKKDRGVQKPAGMSVSVIWISGKKWSPDKSRGKKFRCRPRSKRGRWELQIGKAKQGGFLR